MPRPVRLDPALLERARRALARRDPTLRRVIRRVGPCRMAPRGDPYGQLVRSVVYQQLHGRAAAAIHARLCAAFPGRRPEPEELLSASDAELRALGLSRQKVATLKAVAEAFGSGRIRAARLWHQSDDEVMQALTSVRGVGVWTAHMLLMFSLGRPDVLPVGDYGVRKGAGSLYRRPSLPEPAELETLAEPWRPYRSVAAWYLWRHAETLPVERSAGRTRGARVRVARADA